MPLSNSILSYEDVRATFDRALETERGLQLTLKNKGAAVHYRQRAYKFRSLDRIKNTSLYPQGDPMHGCSPYDVLKIEVVENIVYIHKLTAEDIAIEVKEL